MQYWCNIHCLYDFWRVSTHVVSKIFFIITFTIHMQNFWHPFGFSKGASGLLLYI